MSTPLPPTNVFHVSFSTKGHAGYIRTVKITIEPDVIDVVDQVRIDLAEHPLYKELQAYVKNNPR